MRNKQVLQSCFIILLQLQYITKIRSASRRGVSERVAKTLRVAQIPWFDAFGLTDLWKGASTLLEWCRYPPGELQYKTSKLHSNELN